MSEIEIILEERELALYADIIVNSIKSRVEKIGATGGIVALSGGIDSSLVTLLAHKALGDKVTALIMPESGVSPVSDTEDALNLVEKLGVEYRLIDINGAIDWFKSVFPEGNGSEWAERLTLANVKPRIRMIINYIYSNYFNRIVIGTSNKTELLLGYGTKFGDMAADIYPIGDLYKTQVWQLAEFLGIPTEIIRKKPSAGLWKGQTDEEELGHTYHEIDRVLFALVEMELSVRETSELLGI
ncbi:MAG: NAD+ synthase, partial [Candidatus Hydrothermae bacterium]|nr:NAD+ synthase [Candidatus Hydrothermae bacterium]